MEHINMADNTRIYYKIEGQGLPIILIHGFTANHAVFRVLEMILSKNFTVITYDLRGHGLSRESEDKVTLKILAQDLCELIAKLELKDVTLVGWSLGGAVIFEYISKYGCNNIQKLCIIDSSPKIINDYSWELGLYHGNYYMAHAKMDIMYMITDWNKFSEDFIKKMAPSLKGVQLERAIISMKDNKQLPMIQIWESLICKDYRSILKNIKIPTLLIFGGKSSLYNRNVGVYLNNNIEESKLIILEENTHLLVQENPIGINRVLSEFI